MKKYILVALCLFTTSFMRADESQTAEYAGTLAGTILSGDTNGFFILADGSCWRTVSYVTRWRGPLEWWNGVDLNPPQGFQCTLKEWNLGAPIEFHRRHGISGVDISNASNSAELNQCTHVMINQHTGHVVFGVFLTPTVAMMEIFKTGKAAGFREGEEKGRKETREYSYQAGYNVGHEEGFRKGHQKGFEEGVLVGRTDRH